MLLLLAMTLKTRRKTMKRKSVTIFIFAMITWIPLIHAEPTPEALRDTIRDYVANEEKSKGAFEIRDERTGDVRQLEFVRVHERVGKTGDYYYSCTDMKDVKTGELLDLDFDIEDQAGQLKVADVRIHKDDGIPRYTYGGNDQRVPLPVAELKSTVEGSLITGKVSFMETDEGLKINAVVQNAPPGEHGFHIHEKGDCSDAGNAAGGHFNPDSMPHGDLVKDGFAHAHAGDLGNIEIDANGNGKLEKLIPGLTLKEGKYGVEGRSVILHEKEDNFSQPTGNAGGRIACGLIPKS
jgi:Cu-Zn family superoxide dismutase